MTREEAIKKAVEYRLEEEIAFYIDELGFEPNAALKEWDV